MGTVEANGFTKVELFGVVLLKATFFITYDIYVILKQTHIKANQKKANQKKLNYSRVNLG